MNRLVTASIWLVSVLLFSMILIPNLSYQFQPQDISNTTNLTDSQPATPSALQINATGEQEQEQEQVQEQQETIRVPSLQELQDAEDFTALGTIDSVIYTVNGKWIANGTWKLTVSDNKLSSFDTDMVWDNGTTTHSHEFQNFQVSDEDDDIAFNSDGVLRIGGTMDVGTNGIVSWPDVPAEIILEKGKIVTVKLDHQETERHFGGQSMHGVINSFLPCSIKPGPDMSVPTGTCA